MYNKDLPVSLSSTPGQIEQLFLSLKDLCSSISKAWGNDGVHVIDYSFCRTCSQAAAQLLGSTELEMDVLVICKQHLRADSLLVRIKLRFTIRQACLGSNPSIMRYILC